jgi:uncharacterized protein DUF4159
MRRSAVIALMAGCGTMVCALCAQKPFRQYPAWENYELPPPPDYQVPAEWTPARLMYPTTRFQIDWQSEYRRGFDWRQGNTNWTIDYPRSDRHLAMAVRRLTRLNARSVEQAINLEDDDDAFNYPWLYAVEAGHWELSPQQIAKFREYLLRGGFFMCDDFHGDDEWAIFVATMQKVFPDRQIVDIPDHDAIFHGVFDLDDRYQVPGAQYLRTRRPCEKCEYGGAVAHWRGIYDDRGRLMVAICHNMDLGDSWEHGDDPYYPQTFSALGLRIGVNYVIYSMTH